MIYDFLANLVCSAGNKRTGIKHNRPNKEISGSVLHNYHNSPKPTTVSYLNDDADVGETLLKRCILPS